MQVPQILKCCTFPDGQGYLFPAGVYDEKVLVGLDFVLNEASKRGIRIVLVLTNYWSMYGGIDQYNVWSYEAGSGECPSFCLCS